VTLKDLRRVIASKPEVSQKAAALIKKCPFGDEFCLMKVLRVKSLNRCHEIARIVNQLTQSRSV
jgi:hypothetical protein